VNIKFVEEYLKNITWNLNNQQWQVSGIIDRVSNEYYKFDIRFLKDAPNNQKNKFIEYKNEADKVLFEDDKNWILIDTKEFVKYMKDNNLKEVKLENLLFITDWNIVLPKKV